MAARRVPFADPHRPTPIEIRRWQAGYRRAALWQRELAQNAGVDRASSVALSLEMIDVALAPGAPTVLNDAVRQRGEALVRRTWRRLRTGLVNRR
jgi:hypothetical protein